MKRFSKFTGKVVALLALLDVTCLMPMSAFADSTGATEKTRYLQCDHVEELSDGGKIYVYYIDGVENDFPVPPEGFNPVRASDEDLATYGFPPRPTEAKELAEWTENMSAYRYTPVPVIEQSDVVHGVYQLSNEANINSKNEVTNGLSATTGS